MNGKRPAFGAGLRRRDWLTWSLATGIGLGGGARAWAQGYKPITYVFLHTDSKSATLQRILAQKLPRLAVTVFGRFRDFEKALDMKRADVALALEPLLTSRNIRPTLQGIRGGKEWEPYVLLSAGASFEGGAAGKVVGVVEFLGRTGTQEFVDKLLKTQNVRLKRVTKMEDLLPLLQFSAADGVLVPETAVKAITDRSRLKLRVFPLPDARVGLPGVAVFKSNVRDLVVGQFQNLDSEAFRALGIDRWRAA
jgi:hypothetical protein